jgi:crotonobetainyl-CoA:carnitine CoA-transferase CaiB-like acyl-CoA transferase
MSQRSAILGRVLMVGDLTGCPSSPCQTGTCVQIHVRVHADGWPLDITREAPMPPEAPLTIDSQRDGDRTPLSGIRVVDLSQVGAGPYAASLLGDLGADVIKVEPPGGESFRYIDNLFGEGDSAYFYGVNRSKRSLTLDLHQPAGLETLKRLVAGADLLIVGFRPDAVKRLGITYAEMSEVNDQLVYCQLTAFGEDGPRSHQPGMDILAQALGGIMGLTGEHQGPPIKAGVPMADFVASFLLAFGAVSALRARDLNGHGQKLSINLLDGQVAMLANILTHYDRTQVPVRPHGGGHPQLAPYQPFSGSDGNTFIVACLNDRFWERLARVIDHPDLIQDPRFATNAERVRNREELTALLTGIFAAEPAEVWLSRFDAVGMPCGPIHRLEDVLTEPQVIHNESIVELEHPVHGAYPVPNTPFRLHGTPVGPSRYAPRLGEHSVEILAEAGFNQGEIDSLLAHGVVTGIPELADESPAPARLGTMT